MQTKTMEAMPVVVNLTTAQPEQGMNRSADQVRQAMRAYVDDGRITDEQHESLVRLFVHGKQRDMSYPAVGKLIGYSGSTISRLFNGKYEGSLDEVVVKSEAFLEMDAERQRMKSDKFIETSTWTRINNVCNLAIQRSAITRIIGPSQIGKTHSLMEYKRRAKFHCAYLRIPAAPTLKLCVDAVCRAVGVTTSLRIEEARLRVARAVDENTLLMVDELHELIMSAGKSTAMKVLEWIREIWDNSHCGMCLCGTSSLEDDLINDPRMKGWLGQLDQRCIRVLRLPNAVPMDDIVLAGATYGIKGSTKTVENLLRNVRMNRLTTILAMTEKWCAGMNKSKQKHPLNWESFAQVYNATFEGEVR